MRVANATVTIFASALLTASAGLALAQGGGGGSGSGGGANGTTGGGGVNGMNSGVNGTNNSPNRMPCGSAATGGLADGNNSGMGQRPQITTDTNSTTGSNQGSESRGTGSVC